MHEFSCYQICAFAFTLFAFAIIETCAAIICHNDKLSSSWYEIDYNSVFFYKVLQWNLFKPDLRKNLDLRKIVGTTDFLVHKLFDLRKIF